MSTLPIVKKYGSELRDSKKPLKITVRLSDTKGAVCSDHQNCVIAKAIMRQTKAKWVDVGAQVVLISMRGTIAHRYFLNKVAREQVQYFDTNNGAFAPCKLILNKPGRGRTLGSRSGTKARSGHHGERRRNPTR